MARLRANSKEWLDELSKIDPKQATLTRAIVEAAGREDVCSICGDTPSREYSKTNAVLTVRLCDDCRNFQGGRLTPLPPDGD